MSRVIKMPLAMARNNMTASEPCSCHVINVTVTIAVFCKINTTESAPSAIPNKRRNIIEVNYTTSDLIDNKARHDQLPFSAAWAGVAKRLRVDDAVADCTRVCCGVVDHLGAIRAKRLRAIAGNIRLHSRRDRKGTRLFRRVAVPDRELS